MYAVIATGGKQYNVKEGDVLFVEKLGVAQGETVNFEVIAVVDGENSKIGTPVVDGAVVEGEVLANTRGKKVRIFKMKPKKGYRRRQGHRQPLDKVQIKKISV